MALHLLTVVRYNPYIFIQSKSGSSCSIYGQDLINGVDDFNYSYGSVTEVKQCKLIEYEISDNDYLIILKISGTV